MVLAGASGRTLAFGPGHVDGTPLPGEHGNAVVSGHRDTHFAFLRDLRCGDVLEVQTAAAALRATSSRTSKWCIARTCACCWTQATTA